MKKLLTSLMMLALVVACVCALSSQTNAATVASGTCGDNLTWTLDNAGRLAITGRGAMKDYTYSSPAPWDSNLSKIKTVIIGDYVTSIGNYAFYECSMKSVTIGYNVKTIGTQAFYYCRDLTSVTIPDRVTTIGSDAFNRCRTLTSLTIGNGVETIGKSAFDYCDSLTDVYIKDPSAWCKIQFGDDYTANPMYGADHLHILDHEGKEVTELVLDNTVTVIPDSAFQNCDNLTAITIPDSVTAIGEYAFSQCDSLISLTLSDSIESIGRYAFYNCFNLSYVYYAGTQTQWDTIDIGGDNGPLHVATKHYNHIHDYSLLSPVIKEPTCTESGYIEYLCIYGDTRREELPAVGHQPGVILENTPPTCTAQGQTLFNCRFCGLTCIQLAYALGHDFTGPVKTIEPTCTENGHSGPSCTRCNVVRNDQRLDATGHKMVVAPAVEPTCTEPGLTAGTKCERCQMVGVAQTPVGAALGHDEITHEGKAATCTQIGWNAYVTCSRCEHTTYEEIAALGHNEISHRGRKATCTQHGWDAYVTCSRCQYTTYKEIAALGHNIVHVPAVNPTCTEPGLTAGTACQRCQMVGVAQEVVPATGHSFANGACTICGEPESTPGDLDGVEGINEDDAIYLLQHILMPEMFAVSQPVDFDGNGFVNEDDAIYLLQHVLMPGMFPL